MKNILPQPPASFSLSLKKVTDQILKVQLPDKIWLSWALNFHQNFCFDGGVLSPSDLKKDLKWISLSAFVQIRGIGRGKHVHFVNYFTLRCRLWHEKHRKQITQMLVCIKPVAKTGDSLIYNLAHTWYTPGAAKASYSKSAKRSCCAGTNSHRDLRSSSAVIRSMSAFWSCQLVMWNRIRIVFQKFAINTVSSRSNFTASALASLQVSLFPFFYLRTCSLRPPLADSGFSWVSSAAPPSVW